MYIEYSGKMVTIMSCSDCNVNCKHCYISYTGNFSAENLLSTVLHLKKKYIVRINGSEPLIHPQYIASFKAIGQYGPLTNGLIFQNNFTYLKEIKEAGMSEIHISYHFDIHDKVSSVDKEYLECLFEEIRKHGLKLIIMCTLSKENYERIEYYCQEAVRLGAKGIKFTNLLKQGNAQSIKSISTLSKDDLIKFFKLLKLVRLKYDKSELNIKRCGSFGPDLAYNSNFRCIAGVDNVCITPDYKVYPCIFLSKPGMEIGYFDGERIYIDYSYVNKGDQCIVKELLN